MTDYCHKAIFFLEFRGWTSKHCADEAIIKSRNMPRQRKLHEPQDPGFPEDAKEKSVSAYIRISLSAKKNLERFVGGSHESYADVLRRLVDYFNALPDDDARRVLNPKSHPFKLMLDEHWVDHAFRKERWAWGIVLLRHLEAKIEDESGPPAVFLREQYRQGYAWLCFGDVLRRSALASLVGGPCADWETRYGHALMALRVANAYFKRYREKDAYPVVIYNLASCSSLLAAFQVELALTQYFLRELLKDIAEFDTNNPGSLGDGDIRRLWENLGNCWRQEMKQRNKSSVLADVGRLAGKAMAYLEELSTCPHSHELSQIATSELACRSKEDVDLAFLQFDDPTRPVFERWQRSAAMPLEDICKRLFEKVPSDFAIKEAEMK
jgi:hypothetical protein